MISRGWMRLLVPFAICALAIVFGVSGASATYPDLIYNAEVGTALPAWKLAEIQADYDAGEPIPDETPADVSPNNVPEQAPTGIFPASDIALPFPPQLITPNNVWIGQDSAAITTVVAGSSGPATDNQGVLIYFQQSFDDAGDQELSAHPAPDGVGALSITSVSGTTVSLVSSSGSTGTFDLLSKTLTINK